MAVTTSCSGRISVCRMLPPRLAAPATSASATTESTRTLTSVRVDTRPVRRNAHTASHATAPVNWITIIARNAAPS